MIRFLIAFLEKIENSSFLQNGIRILFVAGFWWYSIIVLLFSLDQRLEFNSFAFWGFWVIFFILLFLVTLRNLRNPSEMLRKIVTLPFSFFLGGVGISLFSMSSGYFSEELIFFFLPLLVVAPLVALIGLLFRPLAEKKFFQILHLRAKQFQLAFFFFFIAFFSLVVFQSILLDSYFYRHFWENIFTIAGVLFIAFLLFSFFFSALWKNLRASERKFHEIFFVGVLGFIISFALASVPSLLNNFYESRHTEALKILLKEGETRDGFQKAESVWFLKKSFWKEYESGYFSSRDREDFEKLFDTTPEKFFAGKTDSEDFRDRQNTNATNSLDKDENAKVELEFAEYDSTILSEIDATKTVVTYTFQNTTPSSQEVVFDIRLPNSESVMTDLKLGLDLELQGVIAPRGAAKKVYEQSLRRNIDPALLAQTGVNIYTLRIFPVPAKNSSSGGRQKVQFTFLSPNHGGEIFTAPQIQAINLRITDKTQISEKLKNGKKIIFQKTISEDQEDFFAHPQKVKNDFYDSQTESCELPFGEDEKIEKREKMTGISVFFDISKSAKGSEEIYHAVFDETQKYSEDFDINFFEFNFSAWEIAHLKDLEFWGYTDSSAIVREIERKKLSEQNIIIVTDDDGFEFSTDEATDTNYSILAKNTISVIQVGNKIRPLRDELTKSILASDGGVFVAEETAEIPQIFDEMLGEKSADRKTCLVSPENNYDDLRKLHAFHFGNLLIHTIDSAEKWMEVGDTQANLGEKYGIVNEYASYIALETDAQKSDLERYSDDKDRYNVEYENRGMSNGASRSFSRGLIDSSDAPDDVDFEPSRSRVSLSLPGSKSGYAAEAIDGADYRESNLIGFLLKIIVMIFGFVVVIKVLMSFFSRLRKQETKTSSEEPETKKSDF